MLVGGAVAVAMLFAGRLLLPQLFAQAARTKSPEMFLAACLVVVIVASLLTRSVGFSPILGALIAGIVIAETEYRGEVEVITAPFRGLGLGIFLITVGMSVNLRTVVENWTEILLALLAVLALKAVLTGFLLRLGGAQASVAAETGVLMASPSETTLIVLSSAVTAKVIAPEAASFWQIVTAMGLTVTPLLAKLGRLAGSRVGRHELVGEIDADLDNAVRGQVMILGFGRVGRIVADMLETHVLGVIPNLSNSFKLDAPGPPVGTIRQDRFSAVYGVVGAKAPSIPVHLEINSTLNTRADYNFDVVQDPFLSPFLLNM